MSTVNHPHPSNSQETASGGTDPVTTPHAPVTVDPAALRGMLADLVLCAGRDAWPPSLNGILLHTATHPDGRPVLVGTSTDRFMLGQAHEPIGSGSLAPTFVRLAEARALMVVLTAPEDPDDAEDAEDVAAGPAVLSVAGGTVTVAYAGKVFQVAGASDWYPARSLPGLFTAAEPATHPAHLAGSYLGVLAAVAERRNCAVVLTVQQPDRPVHAHIGERYRALIMPIKHDRAPLPPPAFLPISADQKVAA